MKTLLFAAGLTLLITGVTAFTAGQSLRLAARRSGAEPRLPAWHDHWRPLVTGGLLILILAVVTTFVVIVPAGHVGVVTWFGRVEERTLPAGLRIVTPIAEQVVIVDVRVQPHTFQEIDAASREYQAVKLTGTMTYHINPEKAYDLYRTVGLDFADKVIDPAFNDFIKEVVPRYAVTEILAQRHEIRQLAKDALGENLARYHILVDDIYLANIRFSPEYEAAIEQKQVAEQQVQTERQILEQRRVQADQRVAEAKGDAQATIERAEGQATANDLLTASLSEPVLTYSFIQKLSDNIQIALVPNGQPILFDVRNFLSSARPQ